MGLRKAFTSGDGMCCGKDLGGNRKILPARLFGGLFFSFVSLWPQKEKQGNGKPNSDASGNKFQIIGR